MVNRELLSPCGLYCGVCGILIAHQEGNEKFKEKLAPVYGCQPEDIACRGCLSDETFLMCRSCPIRDCTSSKGYDGCHQCAEFPCSFIDNFPIPVGKKVIMRAIPAWRELGTEKFAEAEENRYVCPHCGYKLFRGAKRCRSCRESVELD
jgi:ribosomal protein L40E